MYTKESWFEDQKAAYENCFLPEEKLWIKFGADGVLYYDLRTLLSTVACPLYALSNKDLSFALHIPSYALSEGSPQTFSLLYERSHGELKQVVYVNTRRVDFFDTHELAEYVGPSSIHLVYNLIGSLVTAVRMRMAMPESYWRIINEFAEARRVGEKNGGGMPESVEQTAISKMIQARLDKMEQYRAMDLVWSFFHIEEPFPIAQAFSIADHPGPLARIVAVSTLSLSRPEFATILESVCPLQLEDEPLWRRTEEGLNQAERRIYEEIARDFE